MTFFPGLGTFLSDCETTCLSSLLKEGKLALVAVGIAIVAAAKLVDQGADDSGSRSSGCLIASRAKSLIGRSACERILCRERARIGRQSLEHHCRSDCVELSRCRLLMVVSVFLLALIMMMTTLPSPYFYSFLRGALQTLIQIFTTCPTHL